MSEVEEAPLCLPPNALNRLPRHMLPEGTVDTHFHAFAPGARLNVPRSYTPQILTIDDWLALADQLNIARGVLVQPSVYGLDNSVLLAAIARAPERLRGIVVIEPETPEAELERLDAAGVRGVRINTRNKGGLPLSAVEALGAKVAALGWSLQFQVNPEQLPEIANVAAVLGAPVVIDHAGFFVLGQSDAKAHIVNLQRLMDAGQAYVKLSAPYRLTKNTAFEGFGEIVTALSASHPHRLLWATDWPHTELWDNVPDDADLIDRMQDWLGDETIARQVFVDNPQALFFGR